MTIGDGVDGDCVSVVVPTYNSARTLPACLEALRAQKYPYTEILVVDNYSQDATGSIAVSFGANLIFHRGTQSAARNEGLAHSDGRFVLFVDSDQQLEAGAIEECVSLCSSNAVDAVKVPEIFVGADFWGRCSALWKNSMIKTWGPKGGIPRFYRKKVLLDRMAFNDELRWGEDLELYHRLKSKGLKDVWCKSHVFHYEAGSLQNAVRKYLSYGRSVNAFRDSQVKTPIVLIFSLAFSTLARILKNSDVSASVLLGCLFLITVKGGSAALGFLSRAG